MPLQATSGAASYDAFGGGVPAVPNYIEEVFGNYLYTGNGSTQTITNGIDLSGKGGLVWLKNRGAAGKHQLYDTVRGVQLPLDSGATDAQSNYSPLGLSAFSTTGFSLGSGLSNNNTATYASWTFREQPKFFDVVTYTGNGVLATRYISHSLGSVPGCIMVKRTDTTSDWVVIHRGTSLPLILNSTAAASTTNRNNGYPDLTYTDATQFAVSDGASGVSAVNASGGTYVAYLFAHNAGGFGLTGTDNVISCGSFTTDGSGNATVSLGYEPQWVLIKRTDNTGNWLLSDIMRGTSETSYVYLVPNTTAAETQGTGFTITTPTATGFKCTGGPLPGSATYIYIAIRRGPMKVPTSGTSVFVSYAYAGSGAGTYTTGINQDIFFAKSKGSSSYVWNWYDRLRGPNLRLQSNATSAESSTTGVTAFNNTSMTFGASDGFSSASPWGGPYIGYALTRAPSFMDEVCYTGTGSNTTINHNLGVAPELIIVKNRTTTGPISQNWCVYAPGLPNNNNVLLVNQNYAWYDVGAAMWNGSPTSTTFGVSALLSPSTDKMVAYLFATCAGVSKVGSYTGTGTTKQVDCGFTGGARFVLIKRTDSSGSWYVWDVARGIVSGNDPYLLLNSTAAEVTNTDYIDTYSAGFEISSTAPSEINASGGTFIFLAIA